MLWNNEEKTKKLKQLELRKVLDQQIRDKSEAQDKERFLNNKELGINMPILQKMTFRNKISEDQQNQIFQ